jgi:hypothetical protein
MLTLDVSRHRGHNEHHRRQQAEYTEHQLGLENQPGAIDGDLLVVTKVDAGARQRQQM